MWWATPAAARRITASGSPAAAAASTSGRSAARMTSTGWARLMIRLSRAGHSTVTDLARLRGLSTSYPRAAATSAAKAWYGMVASRGCSSVVEAGIGMK